MLRPAPFTTLGLLFALAVIAAGQQPYTLDTNATFNSNITLTYTAYDINSTDQISQGARITDIATDVVHLTDGFSAAQLGSTGGYHASVSPTATPDIVSFHLNGFNGIPKYDRFELGLKLPSGLQSLIDSYLSSSYCQTPGCIPANLVNPYDPDAIAIKVDFILGSTTYTRYGFYFADFSENNATSPSQLGGNNPWTSQPTPYTFRIRFAPPAVGNWTYIVHVCPHGSNQPCPFSYTGSFTVVDSNAPGFLALDPTRPDLKRFVFRDSGKVFFGIGQDIAFAGGDWNSVPADPYAYGQQRTYIADLAANSGNFVRIRLDPWSNPVETVEAQVYNNDPYPSKKSINCVTNYDHNQRHMWEFDQTLKLCEQNGVYIMLNLLEDQFFGPVNGYGSSYKWSTNPYSALEGPDLGMGHTNGGLYKFFTDTTAKNAYQKSLFYIDARWGYSPNIALWEHINETNNLGTYSPTTSTISTYYQDDAAFANNVRSWICWMKSYMAGIDPNHLQTDGYGTFTAGDAPGLNCLDVFSGNSYTASLSPNPGRYSNSTHNVGLGYVATSNMSSKPFLLGEIGAGCRGVNLNQHVSAFAIDVNSDVEFHNSVWSSAFSGAISTALNFMDWDQAMSVAHRANNFPILSAFLKTYVDLNLVLYPENEWPDAYNYPTKFVDNFYLANKKAGATLAYGWCVNRSYSWSTDINLYNLDNTWTCPSSNPGWTVTVNPANAYQITASNSSDPPVRFHNMQPGTNFTLAYFETTGTVQPGVATLVGSTTATSNSLGDLDFRLDFGANANIASPSYSDYAYTLALTCGASGIAASNLIMSATGDHLYFIAADHRVYIYWWDGNAGKWQLESLGPAQIAASNLIVNSWSDHLFFIGTDHVIYNYWKNGSNWQLNWLGPVANAAGNMVLNAAGDQLYFIGTDARIYGYAWDSVHGWQLAALGPNPIAASNLVISPSGDHPFFIGTNHVVYNYWKNGSQWQLDWLGLTANAASNMVLNAAGDQLYFIGTDARIYGYAWDSVHGWQLAALGPNPIAASNLVISLSGDHLFFIGTNHAVYDYWRNGSQWQLDWLGPTTNAAGNMVLNAAGDQLYFIGTDAQIYGYGWDSVHGWQLAAVGPTPIAASNLVISPSGDHLFFIGTDHVVYNYWRNGSQWQLNSLCQ